MIDLKEFRKRNKLTQKQLAAYFACDQGFISQMETGASRIPEAYMSKIKSDGLYLIDQSMMIDPRELAKRRSHVYRMKESVLLEESLCLSCERKSWEIQKVKDELEACKTSLARLLVYEELSKEYKAELRDLTEKYAVLNYRITELLNSRAV